MAAVYDADTGIARVHNLLRDGDVAAQALLRDLDEADSLCSFNGVKFDIPFIAARLQVPAARYEPWILKLTDLFEVCRTALGSTSSLNKVLHANGFTPKTGSGLQAVEWARTKQWDLLESYCLDDARLTWQVSRLEHTLLPLYNGTCATMTREPTGVISFVVA